MAIENKLYGNEVAQDGPPHTQVWQATYTGNTITNSKGEKVDERKSYMDRSFISFSFDDPEAENPKRIEDFNFIAYTASDRMERDAYASFEDLTSTYDVIPGQFYWGTYFHQNTLTFDLATDGIEQTDLDAFKYWFRPGIIRELILSEHPNRAILARVSAPPRLKLLPFEHPVEMTMNNERTYKTSTTLYKGEVELEFTMDEPFWYAKKNILGRPQAGDEYYDEKWTDVNGVEAQIVDSPDALKIIYEDHIPIGSMANINVFYGDQIYVTMKSEGYSKVCIPDNESNYTTGIEKYKSDPQMQSMYIRWPDEDGAEYYDYYYGARIVKDGVGGRIAGATVEEEHKGIELFPPDSDHDQTAAYLYYAGNASSPVTLNFTLTPQFDKQHYIVTPWNKQGHPDEPYNTITLKSTSEHYFKFSLPSLYKNYNDVITILKNSSLLSSGNSWETIREVIRDTIKHPKIRAWANWAIDNFTKNNTMKIINSDEVRDKEQLLDKIQAFFLDSNLSPYSASFEFNAKTGLAIGNFTVRSLPSTDNSDTNTSGDNNTEVVEEPSDNTEPDESVVIEPAASAAGGEAGESTNTTTPIKIEELVENVGDMVKSNYIILDERNVLTPTYQVAAWEKNGGENNSYLITHNVPSGLTQLQFIFKNMYL